MIAEALAPPTVPDYPAPAPVLPPPPRRRGKAARLRRRVLALAGIASLCAAAYWGALASDRYVSEAEVRVVRADVGAIEPGGLGGLLAGLPGADNRGDQLLLRDHLLSLDMLARLDAQLHLRAHYASQARDPLSRFAAPDAPLARFRDYMQGHLTVRYDETSGLLHVEVDAFDAGTARAIVAALLREGAAFMNANDHRLAQAQVDFLSAEAARMEHRSAAARQALLAFQDAAGMVSPDGTLQAVAGTIAQLEARRSALQTQLGTLEAYLVADHPDVVAVRQQIAAVERELARERARAASPGAGALNRSADAFRQLQQEAQFSQTLYQTTLAALEKGRITAMQAMKQIAVIQSPTLPEYPARPHRLANALVFALSTFAVAVLTLLMIAVVRDHVD